jgi:hypothetical protein
MPTPALAPRPLHRRAPDPLREAVGRLADALPERADATVLLDFLEDDLREGLGALSDVEAHFTDVLDALRASRLSPVALLEAGDELHALQRLEYLHGVVSQLRRRLSQAAGMLQRSGQEP